MRGIKILQPLSFTHTQTAKNPLFGVVDINEIDDAKIMLESPEQGIKLTIFRLKHMVDTCIRTNGPAGPARFVDSHSRRAYVFLSCGIGVFSFLDMVVSVELVLTILQLNC